MSDILDANGREQDAKTAPGDASRAQETPGRWVTVQEAAGVLGIQARAVQKRAQGDRLQSRHDGRRLLVWIEDPEVCEGDVQSDQQDANGTRPGPEFREPDASNDGGALVEQLRSEVAFLRDQLEARTSAEAEFRRLLAYAQEQQRADRHTIEGLRERLAITAGSGTVEAQEGSGIVEEGTAPVADQARPWWAFWRKATSRSGS